MAQRVCIIGGGVIGLTTAYALVRDGFEVTVVEACDSLGSETSFANGGQLSYRYVAPLADAGVPLQAIGWMLRGDSPLKLRMRFDPAQWRCLGARHDRADFYGEIPLETVLRDVNTNILLVLHPLTIAPMGPIADDPHRLRPEKDYPVWRSRLPEGYLLLDEVRIEFKDKR